MGKKPNVLILFSDQFRGDALGLVNPKIRTPSLDRLAAEGAFFSHAYTPVPVCVAARHCLMTGLRSKYHGYYSNESRPMDPSVPTLPRILSDAGYVAQAAGKMHFQPPRRHHGFDRMLLMEETPATREEDDYLLYLRSVGWGHIRHAHGVRHLLYHQPQRSILPEEHHGTKWVADRSIEFVRAQKGRPWFLWSGWIAPHPPFNAVDRWAEAYTDDGVPPPRIVPNETLSRRAQELRFLADVDLEDTERLLRSRALYYAQVSFIDEQVGRVLACLEETAQAEDTLVIFTSDHGEMLGDHGTWQKLLPYEECCRIPLIVRFPGRVERGRTEDSFTDLLDIMPTVLDATGGEYPGGYELTGRSLLGEFEPRARQFIEGANGARRFSAVVEDGRKLAHWAADGYEELFALRADPGEHENLMLSALSEENAAFVGRAQKVLLEWEKRHSPLDVGDELPNLHDDSPPVRRHNRQFPGWADNLTDDSERAAMNAIEEEVEAVTAKEPSVKLGELDLDFWVANGGSKDAAAKWRREQ